MKHAEELRLNNKFSTLTAFRRGGEENDQGTNKVIRICKLREDVKYKKVQIEQLEVKLDALAQIRQNKNKIYEEAISKAMGDKKEITDAKIKIEKQSMEN